MLNSKEESLATKINQRVQIFCEYMDIFTGNLRMDRCIKTKWDPNDQNENVFISHHSLLDLHQSYNLDLNWLFTGNTYLKNNELMQAGEEIKKLLTRINLETKEEMEKMIEVLELMSLPLFKEVIMAKVTELKTVGRLTYPQYFSKNRKNGYA